MFASAPLRSINPLAPETKDVSVKISLRKSSLDEDNFDLWGLQASTHDNDQMNIYEEENFFCASKCHDVQLTYFYDARETMVERCIADYPHTLKVNYFRIFFNKDLEVELESFFLYDFLFSLVVKFRLALSLLCYFANWLFLFSIIQSNLKNKKTNSE